MPDLRPDPRRPIDPAINSPGREGLTGTAPANLYAPGFERVGAGSEQCGEEPCWRLGNPQMFKDTHPHLFNIAGSKEPCRDNTLRAFSRATVARRPARQKRRRESG
jgi:hypothetical protein